MTILMILMILIVLAAIAVLIFAAGVAIRDAQALLRWMDDDAFSTSVRRWGYVGARRGGRK